jgi:hypothetical protein
LQDLLKAQKITQTDYLAFREDCKKILQSMVVKLQKKSPLKYTVIQALDSLDPRKMVADPALCKKKMKDLIQYLSDRKQIPGGIKGEFQSLCLCSSIIFLIVMFSFFS